MKQTGYRFDSENHIHYLNGEVLTGVTTIVSVLDKPGLSKWAVRIALEYLGWDKEKKSARVEKAKSFLQDLTVESYIEKLEEAYKQPDKVRDESAEKGTQLHKTLENFIVEGIEEESIAHFVEWFRANVKKVLGAECYSYSELTWTGGISDLIVELKNGKVAVIDFKSAKDVYTSYLYQAWGYAFQVEESGILNERGEVIKKLKKPIDIVGVIPFGSKKFCVHWNEDRKNGIDGFKACSIIYRTNKNMKTEKELI